MIVKYAATRATLESNRNGFFLARHANTYR